MALQCAIVGLETIQCDWIEAIRQSSQSDWFRLVAVGHEHMPAARALGQVFDVPFYVDLRRMMLEITPQIVIIDRPASLPVDFIEACLQQGIGVFSLGPPVHTLAEASRLAQMLEPRTHRLYIWPRMSQGWAYQLCDQTEDYLRGGYFLTGRWSAVNHALARDWRATDGIVRSLSVLAWDACRTVAELLGVPAALYASVQGAIGGGDRFIDATGCVSMTMRFVEATASLVITDQELPARRGLEIFNRLGTLVLTDQSYRFTSSGDGKPKEEDSLAPPPAWRTRQQELEEFCRHFLMAPSPSRGWNHLLTETASMMTAMLVSHRTNNAESPQHFCGLHG